MPPHRSRFNGRIKSVAPDKHKNGTAPPWSRWEAGAVGLTPQLVNSILHHPARCTRWAAWQEPPASPPTPPSHQQPQRSAPPVPPLFFHLFVHSFFILCNCP